MIFAESYKEARDKGYRGLTPLGSAAPVAYLTHDAHQMHGFFDEVVQRLEAIGISWDAWNAEAAPGQFEFNLPPEDPVTAADHAMRARSIIKETALDLGLSVTFMAKPTESYGNGMHIHHSAPARRRTRFL